MFGSSSKLTNHLKLSSHKKEPAIAGSFLSGNIIFSGGLNNQLRFRHFLSYPHHLCAN
jgi:hypothetical protein